MFDDENLKLYGYFLMVSGIVLGASYFAEQPEIEVAALDLRSVETGAIEVSSIPPQTEGPAVSQAWNAPHIAWRSYEEGLEEMRRLDKPGLMLIQADWCIVCDSYQRQFATPEVMRWRDDYVFIMVDADDRADLDQKYAVDGEYVPRTIVLNPEGEIRMNASGTHPRLRYYVDPYGPNQLASLLEAGR